MQTCYNKHKYARVIFRVKNIFIYNLEVESGNMNPKIPVIRVGDVLELKKTHPCGEKRFVCRRVGSDIRIVCLGCGRDLTIPREKLEKSIKKIIPASSSSSSDDHEV